MFLARIKNTVDVCSPGTRPVIFVKAGSNGNSESFFAVGQPTALVGVDYLPACRSSYCGNNTVLKNINSSLVVGESACDSLDSVPAVTHWNTTIVDTLYAAHSGLYKCETGGSESLSSWTLTVVGKCIVDFVTSHWMPLLLVRIIHQVC